MNRLDFVCLDCLPNIEIIAPCWGEISQLLWVGSFLRRLRILYITGITLTFELLCDWKTIDNPKYYSCTELVLGTNQYIACPEQWRVATCHETNEQQCWETKALSCVKQKGLSFCLDWYIACTHGGLRGILTCFLYMSTHITYQQQQRSSIQCSLISTKLNTACLHNPLGSHSSNVFLFFSFIHLFILC